MKIYFSCSITGGRGDQPFYEALVDYLLKNGHEVPTAALAKPEVLSFEAVAAPKDVYERDVNWVRSCDTLIAEVSTPSHGVGYEVALALLLEKPVLCCYRAGRRVSKMITGNSSPTLRLGAYRTVDELLALVEEFLAG